MDLDDVPSVSDPPQLETRSVLGYVGFSQAKAGESRASAATASSEPSSLICVCVCECVREVAFLKERFKDEAKTFAAAFFSLPFSFGASSLRTYFFLNMSRVSEAVSPRMLNRF